MRSAAERSGRQRTSVGHPVDPAITQLGERFRVGAAAVKPDHQRPIAADLPQLIERAEHPATQTLRRPGGKADRAPTVIDDHGLVPAGLGVTTPRVPPLESGCAPV